MSEVPNFIPFPLKEDQLQDVMEKAKDWALMHGAGMRSKQNFSSDSLIFAPFTLLPSTVKRSEFQKALNVQTALNKLIHRVAHSHQFLSNTLKSTIQVDDFTRRLYEIYDTVRQEGFRQRICVGLLRSDYLGARDSFDALKQVEINTIASSFAAIASCICRLHRYVLTELGHHDKICNLPENEALTGLCQGLVDAWQIFANPNSAVLFLVENISYNICDQRFMEFEVRSLSPATKVIRRSLGQLATEAKLSPNNDLLVGDIVIAVVYMRAGYDPVQYPSESEWDARLLVERSTAIKCPSIQYHLAGTKKVQQMLSKPGVVEKFLDDPDEVVAVRSMFTNLYSLDSGKEGEEGLRLGLESPQNYVMKPQREGGGNNIYGEEIKGALSGMSAEERSAWILMERIRPRAQKNYIVRPGSSAVENPDFVVSELGIFGVIIGDESCIKTNRVVGHMLRTKLSVTNEGGVAAGLGALDSPYLI